MKRQRGGEAMDSIQAQGELSDKDLVIFNSELERQSKGPIVAYILWFLLGGLGVHNFYMGKARWGLFYIGLTLIGWGLIIKWSLDKQKDSPLAPVGALALIMLAILLLWDLITIPRQLKQRQERIKQELLIKLRRKTPSAENATTQ
jgi:TM2 domain